MSKVLLVGSGGMAVEYLKVLKSLNQEVVVIGKSIESIKKLGEQFDYPAFSGGLENFNFNSIDNIDYAINAVSVEALFSTTQVLIDQGIKNILIEKPGAMAKSEIEIMLERSLQKGINVSIGYNRRFYQSVQKAKEMIQENGEKIKSFHFEFTEWAHVIKSYNFSQDLLQNWFIANSSHLIDLAFYLGGKPKIIHSLVGGGLDWHTSGSIYVGSGISEIGAFFSYHSNWTAPGRWSLDVLTDSTRYIFKPLEKLQIQKNGSVQIEEVNQDNNVDIDFKPGIRDQVIAFLGQDNSVLCRLVEQARLWEIYDKIKYGSIKIENSENK
ncbi:MAG: hypothetical protein SH817_12230 [Leptospira sp.]|nr:hypothetical protein [Leptospira sp.]